MRQIFSVILAAGLVFGGALFLAGHFDGVSVESVEGIGRSLVDGDTKPQAMEEAPDLYVAFDLLEVGYRHWDWLAIGGFFIVLGSVGFYTSRGRAYFTYMFGGIFCFSVYWTLMTTYSLASGYIDLRRAYINQEYQVVEGKVENFQRGPRKGPPERFTVNGVEFSYHYSHKTSGFNQTSSYGGPIREGRYVRIWHVDGTIIRLEVQW